MTDTQKTAFRSPHAAGQGRARKAEGAGLSTQRGHQAIVTVIHLTDEGEKPVIISINVSKMTYFNTRSSLVIQHFSGLTISMLNMAYFMLIQSGISNNFTLKVSFEIP